MYEHCSESNALLYWPTTSDADVDGTAIEVESSHQYSVMPCCCAR